MTKEEKRILIDADVISHFIACGELNLLPIILAPHKLIILDNVYAEIARLNMRKLFLDAIIKEKTISVIPFPKENMEIKKEYARIKKENSLIGDGERACMAVARFAKDIIASSNFRDIAPYCNKYNILYLGTLDILTLALKRGIFDEERCNQFIKTAKKMNTARFPNDYISDYKACDLSYL